MMHSSHEVRHRTTGHSPTDDRGSPSSPSLAIDVRTNSDDSNDSNGNFKVHGRFRRRRDQLLRSNKHMFVLGGAFSVVAICLLGMWASSTSIDPRGSTRQIDQRRDNRHHPMYNKQKDRKKRPSPKGASYRRDEELFPIPVEIRKRIDEERARETGEDEEPPKLAQKHKNLVRAKAGFWKEGSHIVEKDHSPENEKEGSGESNKKEGQFWKAESPAVEKEESEGSKKKQGHVLTEDSPDDNVGKGKPGGGKKSRHYKKAADDDDEDHANDSNESEEERSDGEKAKQASPLDTKPLVRPVATKMGRAELHPRVLRLQLEKLPFGKRSRGDKPMIHRKALLTDVHRLPIHESNDIHSSDRFVTLYPDDDEYEGRVETVKKSKKYRNTAREALEDEECKPRHEWQKGAFPNCNILHEYELGQLSGMFGRAVRKQLIKREGDGGEMVKYLAHGYWRDVWLVSKTSSSFETQYDKESEFDEEITVLKTLRYRHDFTDRNYDRHRKDALASERLSKSDFVVDIFAYCSNSAIYEYGKGGDIDGKLWPYDNEEEKYYVADIPSLEKIDIAYQVAVGIADMHDVEDDGFASIAHTDITPSQFIFIDGKWKMNDFNRCRFMRVSKEDNSPCGFRVGANPGKFRAPEEYAYDEEDEMIDVYSMGNIFYTLLAGEMPFEGQKESKAQKKVMDNIRPNIPDEVLQSDDEAIRTLVQATKRCWRQKPGDRPKAALIRDFLKETMDRIREGNATKESI